MGIATERRLRRYQVLTVALLVTGYAGYYVCRSNFSVALPLLIDYLKERGFDPDEAKVRLGAVASLGTLAYALGKFVSGNVADSVGGRRTFLFGMLGSAFFTVCFALGGVLPVFTLAWVVNRAVQSLGWVGMVKVSSRWFAFSHYGTVMGIISLSFLFGDAAAREFMGLLLRTGLGWRGVFFAAAGVLLGLAVLSALWLRESPRDVGESEPPAGPTAVYAEGEPRRGLALLGPLLARPSFWAVCLLSLGLTLMRETFNTWTPTYFREAVGLGVAEAASRSSLFPLAGGVSVLIAGFLGDRLGRGGRAAIIFIGLALAGALLYVLGAHDFRETPGRAVALVALVGLVMLGPYSYLAGAVSLDFGGKQGSATACGIIDGVGYLGGILAGQSMARLSVVHGWRGAFMALAACAWLTCLAAGYFWYSERRAGANADPKAPL